MKLKFKSPPVKELVIGVYFDREIASLRSEYVGLFWSQVSDEFPTISQQSPVFPPIGGGLAFTCEINELFPMPRFWLESPDGTTLMQIQRNAFLFNWRKRDTDYPHFDSVKAGFNRNFAAFSKFLKQKLGIDELRIQLAELNYVNVIESGEYWTGPKDTAVVIPRFQLPTSDVEAESFDFSQSTFQRFAPDLALVTTIKTGQSNLNPTLPVLILELRAMGALVQQDKVTADQWFDKAHDVIGNCFTRMTNPDIQRAYWQLV